MKRSVATTLIWSAGTAPNVLIAKLPLPKRNGRIVVDPYLGVEERPGVWAVGDCALVTDPHASGFYPAYRAACVEEGKAV